MLTMLLKKKDLTLYKSSHQWAKYHKIWCDNLDKLILPGTIRLLVTFPNIEGTHNNAPTFEKQSNGRTDVVLKLSLSNMAQFFTEDTCSLLKNFPTK